MSIDKDETAVRVVKHSDSEYSKFHVLQNKSIDSLPWSHKNMFWYGIMSFYRLFLPNELDFWKKIQNVIVRYTVRGIFIHCHILINMHVVFAISAFRRIFHASKSYTVQTLNMILSSSQNYRNYFKRKMFYFCTFNYGIDNLFVQKDF